MDAVIEILKRHRAATLERVRERHGCLAPWTDDPVTYGRLARNPMLNSCAEVTSVLEDVVEERLALLEASDLAYFHALHNARGVAASEAYYRAMHEGSVAS